MKNARYLSMTALGISIFAGCAQADPVVTDPAENTYTQVDPDGIPLSATRPQDKGLTPEEMSALRKAQEKAVLDKDWLVRSYERQLQTRDRAANSQNSNLYYQLSTNKELAKLAGLSVIDTDQPDGTVPVPHSAADGAKLRPTVTSASFLNSAFSSDLLKPLITPFGSSDSNGQHNDYSALLPESTPSLLSDNPHPAPPAPAPDESSDPADIETPGMIAAEKDPLANSTTPDLTLEILPGETPAQAKEREENATRLELPLPMDADQLHRQQAATLSVPGAPPTTQTVSAATPTVKPVPVADPEAPLPVSKEPQISPVRPAIANPFDILNR